MSTKQRCENFKTTVNEDGRLTPGQKNQCHLFLENYPATGIEICRRYIAIVTGGVEVVQEKKGYEPFSKKIAAMLTIYPGMTRRELAKKFDVHYTSINNAIGKGLRRGIFRQEGERVYVR